jgi:hypothetical protein
VCDVASSVEHRGGAFGSYLAPAMADTPQIDTVMIENLSRRAVRVPA